MNPNRSTKYKRHIRIRTRLKSQRKIAPPERSGVALIVVLAAMTILCGVLFPLIPPALRARRQVAVEEIALQNQFLKSAVTQRLLQQSEANAEISEGAAELSGEVKFGDADSIKGSWMVREGQADDSGISELEVVVRLEFQETPESGSSPWLIPKSELHFSFPSKQKSKINP